MTTFILFLVGVIGLVVLASIYTNRTKAKKSTLKMRRLNKLPQPVSPIVNDEFEQDRPDAWEGTFREGYNNFPVQASLRIDYIDGNGMKTSREIDVHEADNFLQGGMIYAYCRMRDANRTFRYDRIRNCTDLETGAIINNVGAYLQKKYEDSPEYAMQLFEEKYTDLVRCLVYIGKADGQFRKEEREVVAEACRAICVDPRITTNTIASMIETVKVPSLQGFKLAVGRVATSGQPEAINALVDAAKNIVATQKSIHPAEQDALEYIAKKYSKVGVEAL